MRNSLGKRIIAFMLCMILVLNGSISGFASETVETEPAVEAPVEAVSEETTPIATEEATQALAAAVLEEETEEVTEAASEEIVEEATEATTEETSEEDTEEVTEEASEEEITEEETEVETESETEEEIVQVLEYEDNDVMIHVEAVGADAIPEGASLKVSPITSGDAQYNEVEKQLNEKAEGEEYEIAGFLAYDITFVDKDGNKVEPNGNVRVTIDYKKATLPEEVNTKDYDELDVTVMHFEENANGEVKEVVDMVAATNIDAQVTTTDDAEVKKAEFVTDSFSVYTVTWKKGGKNRTFSGSTILENGTGIGNGPLNVNLNETGSDTVILSEVKFASITHNNKVYTYKKTVICTEANYNSATAQEVTTVTYGNNKYTARTSSGEEIQVTNSNLYFVYEEDQLHTVATVDHSGTGIVMRMINYNEPNNYNQRAQFGLGGGYGDSNARINWFNHGIKAGLVNRRLGADGYPVTSNIVTNSSGGVAGQSLRSAFEGGTSVNHLFIQSTYDSTGYYKYSSLENYAYLNSNGNFTVYEELGTPADSGDNAYYNRGNFFPYNSIEAGKLSDCQNLYDVNDQRLSGGRAGEALYKTQGNTDYLFGMYLEVPFVQPKDGQVASGSMIYDFVGDDDLWIFIDGVLVLDIGGVHDARGGQINFATGAVTYSKELSATTIKAMFREAGVFPDGSTWNESRAGEYFDGETFADYSSHTMKMFYMERGKGASNLSVKFNIPPVEKESVTVRKELTNYAAGAYSDVEFSYKLYLGNTKTDANLVPAGTAYTLVKADGTTEQKVVNNDGTFVLKHNEQAIFEDVAKVGTKYIVEEVGISSATYDKVDITSTGIVNENDSNIEGSENSVATKPLEIGKDFLVLFKNTCAVTNMKNIVIMKDLIGESTDSYSVKVTVAGQPYTGKYKVGNSIENAYASATEYEAVNGVITLKDDEVAVVLGYLTRTDNGNTVYGFPSGTSFKVEEIGLDATKYGVPSYEVLKVEGVDTASNVQVQNDFNGSISGELVLSHSAQIKVTNVLSGVEDAPEIKVSKTFTGLTQEQINQLANTFKITVVSKDITPAVSATLTLNQNGVVRTEENGNITYTWTLVNYPAGTYTVSEENESFNGYNNVIEINGIAVAANTPSDITTTAATLKYTSTMRETTCSATTYDVGNINLIVAKLTQSEGYFVWTRERISINERLGIVNLINAQNGIHFSPEAILNNCYFYSGDISDTLIFRQGEIKYDGIRYLTFDASKQWAMFATGAYEVVDGDSAEIAFENIYTPKTIDLDLRKVSVNGPEIEGAEFDLYKYDDTNDDTTSAWVKVNEERITATNAAGSAKELTGLTAGKYKLVEVKAPEGFFLLENDIYFKVENETASLTDENGNALTSEADMWMLDAEDKVLTVKNDVLYALPSSGGIGIYWYMIAGMVLMMAATVITYKNRREEVLERINRR